MSFSAGLFDRQNVKGALNMKFIKKTDIIIISILLLLAISLWAFYAVNKNKEPAKYAEIYYKSTLIKRVDLTLSQDYTFSPTQNPNVIFHVFADGSICFEQSDCPDKVCINTGRLSKTGEYAACLPNSLIIKIVSANNRDSDKADIIIQ